MKLDSCSGSKQNWGKGRYPDSDQTSHIEKKIMISLSVMSLFVCLIHAVHTQGNLTDVDFLNQTPCPQGRI